MYRLTVRQQILAREAARRPPQLLLLRWLRPRRRLVRKGGRFLSGRPFQSLCGDFSPTLLETRVAVCFQLHFQVESRVCRLGGAF